MRRFVKSKSIENRIAKLERKIMKKESIGEFANKLIEACEDGYLDWETLARECVAENSESDNEHVCAMLDLDLDDWDD